MALNDLKNNLRQQIADGHTPSVLAFLMSRLSDDSEYFNSIYTIQGSYSSIENQLIGRLITDADYKVENAKINHALLLLIENLSPDDFKKTDVSELEELIEHLKLAPQPPIKLVDCDRGEQYQIYSDAFRKMRRLAYQFCFLTAKTSDQPANFTERIVNEIILRTKDNVNQAINFPHRICTKTNMQRVDFVELPFDDWGDVADNQNLFRQHFAERMRLFGLENVPIEDFVGSQTKRLPYRYFTFLFRINFDKWGWLPELTEYLLWIIQTFKANPSVEPLLTFQFAFIISSEKNNVSENPDIKAGIEAILRGANDAEKQPAFWLKDFTPVPPTDLFTWFTDMTKQQSQPQIKYIIQKATAHLDEPEQPAMADLEDLFVAVYNVSNRLES